MVTYGIYNTEGKLLAHGIDGLSNECSSIAASISSATTSFYVSSKHGRRVLGTVFEVTQANRRSRPIVYVEETAWIMNTPSALREEEIAAFLLRAADTIEREGYVILGDNIFISYLERLQKQKREKIPSDTEKNIRSGRAKTVSRFSSQIISQTLGRILYGKSVWSTTKKPETAVAYLCAVSSSFLKVLDAYPQLLADGFTFSIASSIVEDVDVNVFLSSSGVEVASINLDSLEPLKDDENNSYYEKCIKIIQAKNRKGAVSLSLNRDLLPKWIIQQTLAARGIMTKEEREKYKAFLTGGVIHYDRKVFDDIDREEEERERRKREKAERERKRREEEIRKTTAPRNYPARKTGISSKKRNGEPSYVHILIWKAKELVVNCTKKRFMSGKRMRLFIILALCMLAAGLFVFALIDSGYIPVLESNVSDLTNIKPINTLESTAPS